MDPSHYFSPQQTKRRVGKETPVQVLSCEFSGVFKNTFFKNTSGGLSLKMNTTKPSNSTWHPNWTIVLFEWFVMNYFGNPFFYSRSKVKMRENKWIISLLRSFKKGSFSLKKTFLAELYSPVISSLHSSYEIYTKGG